MTTAIHIKTTILPGGKIEVTAPELPPGKRANVFVVLEDEEPTEKPHALDIIKTFTSSNPQ